MEETLAEGSLATQPPKAQTPEGKALDVSGVSDLSGSTVVPTGLGEVSVAGTQENGVRVSVNKNDGVDVDVVVVATRVFDTEVSVAEESQKTGDSSGLQENGKELGLLHENGKNTVEGDVSMPAVNDDEKIGVQKIVNEDGSRVNGGDSARKIEVSGNGISLVVEVHGSSASTDQDNESEAKNLLFLARKENPTSKSEVRKSSNSDHKSMYKENRASLPENEEDPCAKVTEMPEITKNSTAEDDEKEQVSDEEEDEEMDDQEYKFSVGDFVWGKIKSHPWWPGQIYDPSDASKYAAKYQRRDRPLVAYFGDGTFAWCYPSQLKPFQENFERMSKQSNSKSFLNAVEKAVDEIGRRVELEMTCFCIPKETQTGLARPLAMNAGIKEGITVPEGGIGEHSITRYEPAKFLARLRYIAQVVSISSMLELTVIRSRLSAFYHAKGYSQLPMYHQPHEIIDPENKAIYGRRDKSEFDGQMGNLIPSSPEEDWLSSPIGPGVGKASQTSSRKCPGISEDKLYQRKQKSMAELLGGEVDVEPENYGSDVAKEGTVSGKPTSSSRKKKRNKDSEVRNGSAAEDIGGSKSATPSKKRKMTRHSGSPTAAENKGSWIQNDDGGGKVKTKKGSALRERKKSKYLSPPYTILIRGHKSLSSLRDSETEIPKVPKVSRLRECMGRAFGRIQSPPIVKCSGETFQKKPSKEPGIGRNMSERLSPRTPKQNQNKIVSKEGKASANQMLLKQNQNKVVSKESKASANQILSKQNPNKIVSKESKASANQMLSKQNQNMVVSKESKASANQILSKQNQEKVVSKESKASANQMLSKQNQNMVVSKESKASANQILSKQNQKKVVSKESKASANQILSKQIQKKVVSKESKASANLMLSEFQYAALDPLYLRQSHYSDTIKGFFSRLRSSLYRNGSNYEMYKKLLAGQTARKKRKSLDVKPGSLAKDKQETDRHSPQGKSDRKKLQKKEAMPDSTEIKRATGPDVKIKDKQEIDHHSPQDKSDRKKLKRKKEAMPDSTKIKRATGTDVKIKDKQEFDHHSPQGKSDRKKLKWKKEAMPDSTEIKRATGTDVKINDKEEAKGEASSATLLMTFAQGFPLPSKDNLMTKFSRFGVLNVSETEVLEDSGSARVVYLRSSDAETAFNSSKKINPFGPAVVSYRLRYVSATSRALKVDGNSRQRPTSLPAEGGETPANPSAAQNSDGETPPLLLLRQNLEVMTSVLEKSKDKLSSEVKANLEDGIKDLLKKVSTMVESSSLDKICKI